MHDTDEFVRSRWSYLVVGEEWACQGQAPREIVEEDRLDHQRQSRHRARSYRGSFPTRNKEGLCEPTPSKIGCAARQVGNLAVHINNAGIALYDDLTLLC